ncbi:hypothetical protein E2C01_026216 [Portunus trituberculatus]|uniref:Uncharacterized protein n=1 Tax=Portunus trituberculatus TaxID=210409 RepID=A0A5B7EIJ4_PORTR|nr:hypothetical protein [Portunus trituberculatus]
MSEEAQHFNKVSLQSLRASRVLVRKVSSTESHHATLCMVPAPPRIITPSKAVSEPHRTPEGRPN